MNRWGEAIKLIGVGFYIGGSIVVGVGAGLWLDSRFHTGPILMILGLFCGLFVAGYGVYHMLLPFMNNRGEKGKK